MPTIAVKPELPDTLPEYNEALPLVPRVIDAPPEKLILPPVDVPALVDWPALRISAYVLVFWVLMF